MVPFIAGIVLIVLATSLAMPYILYLLCLIGGIILVLYGVFVIFRVLGGAPGAVEPTTRRRRDWWY